MSPCDALPNGLREICEGQTAHTPKKRHAYLMQWLASGAIERLPDGYEYTPDPEPPKNKSRLPIGDAVAKVTSAVGIMPCGGCKQRQQTLNDLGDKAVDVATKIIGKLT